MNNKLLKSIEYLFYLLVLLYLVGKSFEVITILIDIIFIIFILKNKEEMTLFFNKYKVLIYSFCFLLFYFFIQSLFTNFIIVSLKHSVGSIRFIILFFAILYVFNDVKKIKNVIYASFLSLFIVNIDSLYQFIFNVDIFGVPSYLNGKRLTAWNDMPIVNLYSGIFSGLLLSSVLLFKGKEKKIALFSLMFFFLIFFLSGNRSPIVALFSTLFFIGFFTYYRKYLILIFIGISLAFSLTLFNDKLYNGYKDILNPTSNKAINGREQIYITSFEMIKNNTIFGLGAGTFRYEFLNYYEKNYDRNSDDFITKYYFVKAQPYHPHNVVLDLMISYGLFGLVLFGYLFFNIYKFFIKGKPLTLIASIGLIYCITPFQFAKSLSQSNWQFYTFLALILMVLISTFESKLKEEENQNNGIQ